MAPSASTGAGVKVSKLQEWKSVAEKKYKYTELMKRIDKIRRQVEKIEENTRIKENKRINKIRRRQRSKIRRPLGNSEENKRISKIRKHLGKLEQKGVDEITTLIYDRDSTTHRNRYRAMDLKIAAKLPMGYFNRTSSTKYHVLEVIRATKYMCAGHVLCLTFTAVALPDRNVDGDDDDDSDDNGNDNDDKDKDKDNDHDEDDDDGNGDDGDDDTDDSDDGLDLKVETFEAEIYYGIGETEVRSVRIVGSQPV